MNALYYPNLTSCSANLSYSQINWLLGLPEECLGLLSKKKLANLKCELSPYENKARGIDGLSGSRGYKNRVTDGNNNTTFDDKLEV